MANLRLKAKIIERFGSQSAFAAVLKIREPIVSRVIHGYETLEPEEQTRWAIFLDESATKLFQQEGL